jgi:hypothetical protein
MPERFGENNAERLYGEQRTRLFCERFRVEVAWAAEYLHRSIENQHQPNREDSPEWLALWYTTALVEGCEEILNPDNPAERVLRFIRNSAEPCAVYDIETAIHAIPRLVPHVLLKAEYLPNAGEVGLSAWCKELVERTPGKAARWHTWLWQPYGNGGYDEQQTRQDTACECSNAALLEVACTRLSAGLSIL